MFFLFHFLKNVNQSIKFQTCLLNVLLIKFHDAAFKIKFKIQNKISTIQIFEKTKTLIFQETNFDM